MDRHVVRQPTDGGAGEWQASVIERSVRQGWPRLLCLYVFTSKPLFNRFWDGAANSALRGVLFAFCLRVKVSAYADDISLCILPIRYKSCEKDCWEVAGAKISFDKSKGLRSTWEMVTSARTLRWSDGPFCILGVWFRPSLQLEWNWLEVCTGRSTGGYLSLKVFVLKGQGGGVHWEHLPLDPLPVVCTSPA